MNTRWVRATRPAMALAVGICAVAIAACGSSSKKPAAKSRADTAIAFSQCMRGHGVPNFPDASAASGLPVEHLANGGVDLIVNGVPQPVNGPALQSAMNQCGKYMIGFLGQAVSDSQGNEINQALLKSAECTRAHGVPNFPDPTPPGGGGAEDMSPTARAQRAGINIDSPAFKAAVKTCAHILSAALNGRP